jgi:predicted ester cyclase
MVGQFNNRIESGNTMVEECSWTGTNTGEITAPDGSKIPPTGKTVNIKNCFIYEFENEKIKSMKNYLDMMGMMGQLGLAG